MPLFKPPEKFKDEAAKSRYISFEKSERKRPKRTGKYEGKNPMFAQISPKGLFRFCSYTWWRSGHITYHEEKWPEYRDELGKVIGFDIEIIYSKRFDYSLQVLQRIMQMDQRSDCGLSLDYRIFPTIDLCSTEEELQRQIDRYKWEYIEQLFRKRVRDAP